MEFHGEIPVVSRSDVPFTEVSTLSKEVDHCEVDPLGIHCPGWGLVRNGYDSGNHSPTWNILTYSKILEDMLDYGPIIACYSMLP